MWSPDGSTGTSWALEDNAESPASPDLPPRAGVADPGALCAVVWGALDERTFLYVLRVKSSRMGLPDHVGYGLENKNVA